MLNCVQKRGFSRVHTEGFADHGILMANPDRRLLSNRRGQDSFEDTENGVTLEIGQMHQVKADLKDKLLRHEQP